jgi:ribonuclease Z
MNLLFLGTGAGTPSRQRNVSALALIPEQRSEWWLFDCGEGTQHQVLRAPISLPRLRRIFITHLHGDHCFGLPGLLASRAMQNATEPLDIYGPRGIADLLESVRRVTEMHLPYQLTIHEVSPGIAYEDDEYTVRAVAVVHAGQTHSHIVDEKPKPGRFRIEDAQKLNIPPGPLYARLKRGERVKLDDGREIDGATLVDPPRAGRKLALLSDTCDAAAALPFSQQADVVVHEATFLGSEGQEEAHARRHSTAADAGRFAAAVNARQLVLTHISARYEQESSTGKTVADIIAEARSVFGGEVILASDLLSITVPRR